MCGLDISSSVSALCQMQLSAVHSDPRLQRKAMAFLDLLAFISLT
jgi:hypothetical protein